MKQYEQIDISGDVGLRIFGASIDTLFENAAAGMYDLITNAAAIKETEKREVVIIDENQEDLLVRWLNELVFLYDTHGFTGKRVTVRINTSERSSTQSGTAPRISLNAVISGGIFDPDVHERRLLIKAATYHNLTLRKINAFWEATVIFDI